MAVLCLGHKLENFLGFGPVLPGQGQEIMSGVHSTGAIMPWHRYAISLWEEALISECGWQDGGVPCKVDVRPWMELRC